MPRGWSWVDPLKEVKAYREAEQAGYMTKQQVIAYSGGDFDDNVAELAREQQIAADAGVKLDKDLDLTDEAMQLPLLESEEPQPTRKRTNGKRKRS
jgi:capsid protein